MFTISPCAANCSKLNEILGASWSCVPRQTGLCGGGLLLLTQRRSVSLQLHRNEKWTDWQLFLLLCQGIVKRDEIVFRAARRRGIPILMVTSGGYQKKTARIIADSILNLHQQGLIRAESLEGEGSSLPVTSMVCSSASAGSTFTTVWGAVKGTEVTFYCAPHSGG